MDSVNLDPGIWIGVWTILGHYCSIPYVYFVPYVYGLPICIAKQEFPVISVEAGPQVYEQYAQSLPICILDNPYVYGYTCIIITHMESFTEIFCGSLLQVRWHFKALLDQYTLIEQSTVQTLGTCHKVLQIQVNIMKLASRYAIVAE